MMEYDRSKDPMLAMDYARSDAPRYSDLHHENESLRAELEAVKRERDALVKLVAEGLESQLVQTERRLRYEASEQLTTCQQQRDELASTLNEFDDPYQIGDVWQWTGPAPEDVDAALAKVGAEKEMK